jgi:prepilin-type N-terminal cleavage/methylation domain-containing protein
MRQPRQRHGNTLIEIILVIILIGILATIIMPKFGAQAERAKIARTKANIVSIRSAIRIYQADHDGKPPTKLSDLVPDYLPMMPLEAITDQAAEKEVLDGAGGWVYDDGKVLVNLSGTDTEGMDYTKY